MSFVRNQEINYRFSPAGVDVDLGAGQATNDGYGDTDTILGQVYELEGTDGDDTLRGSDGRDRLSGGPGDDMLNPGDNDRCNEDTVYGSVGDDTITYTDSGASACQSLRYSRGRSLLSEGTGVEVTLNGATNVATVGKGSDGTDTIVDIANPLNASREAPYGSFSLYGTFSDDTFDLTLDEGQWMSVRGEAGNDTFDVSGSIRIDYRNAPGGIHVDLGAGRARNDGYGDVDTFRSAVYELRGTRFSDVIIGSDNDERFIGRQGDDTIDGGGGYDRLRLDRPGVGSVQVNLDSGTATGTWVAAGPWEASGTWNTNTFFYTIRNIERVQSGPGDDSLIGSAGSDRLESGDGNDELLGGAGDDRLYGGEGGDRLEGGRGDDRLFGGDDDDEDFFVFEPGHGEDRIYDFHDGEDIIVLSGLGVSKSQVIEAASPWSEGIGVWIDLRPYGGGTLSISDFAHENLEESDLLL